MDSNHYKIIAVIPAITNDTTPKQQLEDTVKIW